jgi:hypothetical protein
MIDSAVFLIRQVFFKVIEQRRQLQLGIGQRLF